MTTQETIARVRSAIDELPENESGFVQLTDDEQNMDRIIADKIGYGVVYVLEHAPLDKMDAENFLTISSEELDECFNIDNENVGILRLPDKVLRVVDAYLSSWPYSPAVETNGSQVALMQGDKYARGSYDRPVIILKYVGNERALYMYSAQSPSDELLFTYIAKPDVSGYTDIGQNSTVDIPTKLEAALVYQIAGLVMTAYREDIAASLFAIARKYMGIEE